MRSERAREPARLREKYTSMNFTGVVGREDIEDVVSRWTGVPIASSRKKKARSCCASKKSAPAVIRRRASRRWPAHSPLAVD